MKKFIIILSLLTLNISCSESAKKENKTEVKNIEETEKDIEKPVLALADFDGIAVKWVNKEVQVNGIVDHVCKHGGKKLLLVNDNGDVHIESETRFDDALIGDEIAVIGVVIEFKVDEAYCLQKEEDHLQNHKDGTDSEDVYNYLSQFTSWHEYVHEVVAEVDGKIIPIPFNINTLYEVFASEKAQILEEKLVERYGENQKIPILELLKIEDVDLKELGQYIYDKIFVNYTAKQWGKKPEEIDGAVTARVPVLTSRDNRYFRDKYQAVPKQGYTRFTVHSTICMKARNP